MSFNYFPITLIKLYSRTMYEQFVEEQNKQYRPNVIFSCRVCAVEQDASVNRIWQGINGRVLG